MRALPLLVALPLATAALVAPPAIGEAEAQMRMRAPTGIVITPRGPYGAAVGQPVRGLPGVFVYRDGPRPVYRAAAFWPPATRVVPVWTVYRRTPSWVWAPASFAVSGTYDPGPYNVSCWPTGFGPFGNFCTGW